MINAFRRGAATRASATMLAGKRATADWSIRSFTPPPTNVYHGTPVYESVDIGGRRASAAAAARNADPEAVFLVTGASRSMGLQFVRELMARTSGRVVACVMRPGSAPDLDSYLNGLGRDDRSRVGVHKLDVTDADQIEALATEVGEAYGRVDGLFNVAGVLGDRVNTPGPEMNLGQMDAGWAASQMAVNAIGPMMMTSRFAPLLRARKGKNTYLRTTGSRESVVVNLSARVASIDDNQGGLAWYTYRMSKAALNAGVRASSHELRRQGTWTLSLYPGMTDTAMSRPFQSPALREKGLVFPVDFVVGRLMDVVDGMEEEHSGGFYDWAGQSIPF
jgi:NAD(P)-dependent dehydrogenase (short-subunit alcohol dehydrogenase family)